MLPRILLTLLLTAPIPALAQYVTVGPNGQVLPAGSSVVVVGQGGGPVLGTPAATFATPTGTAGISLADRAGISLHTPSVTVAPGTGESFPVYSNTNMPSEGFQPEIEEATPALQSGTEPLISDFVPGSSYGGAAYVGAAHAGSKAGATAAGVAGMPSLGEIAAKYKAERPQNVRTYTNADAERLSNNVDVHGVNMNPVTAQAAQPASQTQMAGTQSPAPPSTQQLAANARPSPGTPAGTSATAYSEPATSQSATTPQISQAKTSKSHDRNRLPASSTLLPLVGVLGLGCGVLGLWLRKRLA